jgi:hypothetical protein
LKTVRENEHGKKVTAYEMDKFQAKEIGDEQTSKRIRRSEDKGKYRR